MHNRELELAEREYDLDFIRIIYVGGGSVVARNFTERYRSNVAYDCDIKANAKGYEYYCYMLLRHQNQRK